MKFLIKLFIFLIVIAILGAIGLYFSYETVDEGPITYIKTKFRSLRQYESGTYIFPEKLMFWEKFEKYEINDQKVMLLTLDMEIALPPLTKDQKLLEKLNIRNEDFNIKYSLSFSYKLPVDYQLELINQKSNEKNEKFDETFKQYINTVDKGIIISELEKLLHKSQLFAKKNQALKQSRAKKEKLSKKLKLKETGQPKEAIPAQDLNQPRNQEAIQELNFPLELKRIFQYADQAIIKEIVKRYPQKKMTITGNQKIHSLTEISISSFEKYLQKKQELKKLEELDNKFKDQERQFLLKKSQYEAEIKNLQNKEKLKIESEIEKLKMYGKLFKEYPETLNYLYLNKLSDKINILVSPKDAKSFFAPFLPPKKKKIEQLLPKKKEKGSDKVDIKPEAKPSDKKEEAVKKAENAGQK